MPETVICVAAVVRNAGRILLVRQAAGHSLAGQWTVPWGRLEAGESPAAAAIREAREEGAIRAEIEGLLGVQELPPRWQGWLALVYLCRHVDGTPAGDGKETDAAAYFSAADITACADPIEPWSAWLVRRVFAAEPQAIAHDPTNPFHPAAGFL